MIFRIVSNINKRNKFPSAGGGPQAGWLSTTHLCPFQERIFVIFSKSNLLLSIVLIAFLTNTSTNIAQINGQENTNSDINSFFNKANQFFAQNVNNGLLNYAQLKTNETLPQLIQQIAEADISKADDATIQAFYINAYNLAVIDKIIQIHPVNSVMDKSGFFDQKKFKVAGENLTLNKLEKERLLKKYKDPRFHFVLVCGALGCPPITNFAYQPKQLEEQLNSQTQKAINDPNFIKVAEKEVALSQIFEWYINDFGGTKNKTIEFVNQYKDPKIPSNSNIKYYEYDWTLNNTTANTIQNTNEPINKNEYNTDKPRKEDSPQNTASKADNTDTTTNGNEYNKDKAKTETSAKNTTAKANNTDTTTSQNEYNTDKSINVKPNNANRNNANRYVTSAAIPKGQMEIKWFNNLYSQETGNEEMLTNRSTFLTSSLSYLYGINNRFNLGFATRYRFVRNDQLPSSPLAAINFNQDGNNRTGLTAFGPQIRYAPFPALRNFSIQSSFVFPIGKDLAGSETKPYIDWNGPTWTNQFFNDFSIGGRFALFTEIDFLWEDIGNPDKGHTNRISTPVTTIFSYFPNPQTTVYTLAGFSPYWLKEFDYFTQFGLGFKYQFTPRHEVELLYTDFSNRFLNETGGRAATYNIGFRFTL